MLVSRRQFHRGNMDRRTEPSNPPKGRSGSNHGKIRIPLLGYKDELVSGGGAAIRSHQKERTSIEIRRQREHSHTWYSPRDPLRSLQPPRENYLKEAVHPSGSGELDLPVPHEHTPQGGFSALYYLNNGKIMEKQDEKLKKNKERDVSVKKNRNVYFCFASSRYFSMAIHRVIDRLKNSFNLTWLRVRMSYHRYKHLAE